MLWLLSYCLIVCVISKESSDDSITHEIDPSNSDIINANATTVPPIVMQKNGTANTQHNTESQHSEYEPSALETESPTKSPTESQMGSYTKRNDAYDPSKLATETPSKSPSELPTELFPESNGAYEPSQIATEQPTKSPSESHSNNGTKGEPSKLPRNAPNTQPSEITESPTSSPTASPSVCPTKAPSTSPTISPTKSLKTIDWNLSYETKTNVNKAITHYSVIFESFECADIKCQCNNINLKISIESIERELHSLKCEEIFNHFEFNILPGIVYTFEIIPSVEVNNQPTVTESKAFLIKEQMHPKILSFGLVLVLPEHEYNKLQMDANYLSNKLTNEIVALVGLNRNDILVEVQPPINGQTGQFKIKIAKIEQTNTQIAIEKIRNLYYQPVKTSVISTIVQKSLSMQTVAISLRQNLDSDASDSRYNYGATFCAIIVIGACCWLMSKYYPTKFTIVVNICKLMIENFIAFIQPIMRQIVYFVSRLKSGNINNQSYMRQYSTKYDVLNISEDLEMGDLDMDNESGIVLLNQIFDEQNIPHHTRDRYIGVLKDNWLTKTEQLQQLNKDDWKRFDIPPNIQQAIESKFGNNSQNESFVIGEGTSSDRNNDNNNSHGTSSNLDTELSYQLTDDPIHAAVGLIPTKDDDLNLSDSFSDF